MRTIGAIAATLALLLSGCVGLSSDGSDAIDAQSIDGSTVGPQATVTPASGSVDTTFTFDASASDASDDATFSWDFGDGTTDTGPVVEHVFAYDNNAYDVVLTVTEGASTSSTTLVVPVGSGVNTPPSGELRAQTGWAAKERPVSFETTATDPDGDPVEVQWFVAKNLGEGGDGHDHSHGGGASAGGSPYGLDEPIGTGPTLEHAFADSGQYRIKAKLVDPKGGVTELKAIIKVTTSPPRPTLSFQDVNTLHAGSAGQGVSMVLYELMQPSENTYIDAARYDFAVRYPGSGTILLEFMGAGSSPADLDLQIVNAENDKAVATYDATEPAVGAPGTEGGEVTLPVGTYTAYVLAKAGAEIDYTLSVDLELVVPGLDPIVVTSSAPTEGGHGDGHAHDH